MSTMSEDKKIEFIVVNEDTGEEISLYYQGIIKVCDLIKYLADQNFIILSEDYYWTCYFDEKHIYWNDQLKTVGIETGLKSGEVEIETGSRIVLRKKETKEINITIVNHFGGTLDIEVPTGATVGDLIEGLIAEGFLSPEGYSNGGYYFFKRGEEPQDVHSEYILRDERYKPIEEMGWENGDELMVSFLAILYGCPTAKELPGLVPECMLSDFKGFIVGEV